MEPVHFLNLEYIFLWIYEIVKNFDPIRLLNLLIKILSFLQPFAIVFSLLLLTLIVYTKIRMYQLDKLEAIVIPEESNPEADKVLNEKWIKVQEHINSLNPNDWRMAIIEADIMLEDILTKSGYRGDTIGDKLKQVEAGDMLALNDAWEAHKARNQIAHEGSNYQLNDREAKRIIELYKKVFEEFYYI
jgi:hypothetical protein